MKPYVHGSTLLPPRPHARPRVEDEVRQLAQERAGAVAGGKILLRRRFDEVGLMELVLALEEAFDVDIDPDEVERALTLDDLVARVTAQVARRPGQLGIAYAGLDGDRDSAPPSVR